MQQERFGFTVLRKVGLTRILPTRKCRYARLPPLDPTACSRPQEGPAESTCLQKLHVEWLALNRVPLDCAQWPWSEAPTAVPHGLSDLGNIRQLGGLTAKRGHAAICTNMILQKLNRAEPAAAKLCEASSRCLANEKLASIVQTAQPPSKRTSFNSD